jgi:hypothetical protein
MQLPLNAYLVTLAVDRLALEHVGAGLLLAIAQLGGLIGRLLWGLIATRRIGSRTLLAGLRVGMPVCADAFALARPNWSL